MNLGELSVILGAITDRFDAGMREAREQIKGVVGGMRDMVKTAAAVVAATAAAGAALVAAFVKGGIESVATQAKFARAVNASIDGVRALSIAADDLGLAEQDVNNGIEMLNQKLGEFQRQAGPGAKMLEQLGLKAADLARMDADQRLAAIADRVRALGLSSAQAADLARQLGLRGAEWSTLLQQGGDAIRAARQEVDEFGLSISEVDAQQVLAAQDAMENIGRAISNIRDQIAIALAPLLGEVAERMNAVAGETGGFREHVVRAVELSLRGFGRVADVLHGLRVVFKGVQLVAAGFGAAVTSIVQIAAEGITAWIDLVIAGVNKAIDALNKLPKVDIANVDPFTDSAFMHGLRGFAEASREQVSQVRAELHGLAMQELPSSRIAGFLDDVRERARAAAEQVVQARQAMQSAPGVAGFGVDDSDAKKAAEEAAKREHERLMAEAQARMDRIEALRQHLKTEEQLEIEAAAARGAALEEMSAAELEQMGGYHAVKEALEKDHFERLKAIREAAMTDMEKFHAMSWDRQVTTVAGQIANMTAGVASGNRKMFELNKAAATRTPAVIPSASRPLRRWPPLVLRRSRRSKTRNSAAGWHRARPARQPRRWRRLGRRKPSTFPACRATRFSRGHRCAACSSACKRPSMTAARWCSTRRRA
jgi:hypothetical protein